MAEIELSVLSRQCLQGRIPDALALTTEMDAWQADRNHRASKARWQLRWT
jgi:hypothetical protein